MKMLWIGWVKIIATINGLPSNILLNDVKYAENLPWNIVFLKHARKFSFFAKYNTNLYSRTYEQPAIYPLFLY